MSHTITSMLTGNSLNFEPQSLSSNVQFQPIFENYNVPGNVDYDSNLECIGFQITKKTNNIDWTDMYTKNTFIKGTITDPEHAITKQYLENNLSNIDNVIIIKHANSITPNLYGNILHKNVHGNPSNQTFKFIIDNTYVGYDNITNTLTHDTTTFGEDNVVLFTHFSKDTSNIEYNSLFYVDSIVNNSSNIELSLFKLIKSSNSSTSSSNGISSGIVRIPFGSTGYYISNQVDDLVTFTKTDANISFDQSNIDVGTIITNQALDSITTSYITINTDNLDIDGNIIDGNVLYTKIFTNSIANQSSSNVNISGGNITSIDILSCGVVDSTTGNISFSVLNDGMIHVNNMMLHGNINTSTDSKTVINKEYVDTNRIKLFRNISEFYSNIDTIHNIHTNQYKFVINVDWNGFDATTNTLTDGHEFFGVQDVVLFSHFGNNSANIENNGIYYVHSLTSSSSNIELVMQKVEGGLSNSNTNQVTNESGNNFVFLNSEYNISDEDSTGNVTFTKFSNRLYYDQSNINVGDIITDTVQNHFINNDVISSYVVIDTDNANTSSNVGGNVLITKKLTGTIAEQNFDDVHITGGNITTVYNISAAKDSLGNPRFQVDGSNGFCTAVNFTASSDSRLKENICDISDPLSMLSKMNGKQFFWKNSQEQTHPSYGFIAQDLEEYFPSLVYTSPQGQRMKSVDYDKITSILVESVKTLTMELRDLKENFKRLEMSIKSTYYKQ